MNMGSKLSFVLQVGAENPDEFRIKSINKKPLPIAEGFWNNQSIVLDNNLLVLQNVGCQMNNNCLENERKLLKFNGIEWKVMN